MPPAGLTAHSTANQGNRGDGVMPVHNRPIIALFHYLHKCFVSGRLFMIVNDIRFLDFARNDTGGRFLDFAAIAVTHSCYDYVLQQWTAVAWDLLPKS